MAHTKYANAAQQRVLLTLDFLANHPEGASPGEIAKALNTLASNATRDLANLRLAGMAAAVDGRWSCSPTFLALLGEHPRR
jgi:DNA-binding IclR family transcriptional regulator